MDVLLDRLAQPDPPIETIVVPPILGRLVFLCWDSPYKVRRWLDPIVDDFLI